MCGINGLISLNNQVIKDGELLIKSMNKAIAHRGPDDTGVWQHPSEKILLGHQRLSIIDLTPSGHQPMSEEGGNTIVFNGEIYNYKDCCVK
jgi:asparagine synthase (glutamine-hydrolysing)